MTPLRRRLGAALVTVFAASILSIVTGPARVVALGADNAAAGAFTCDFGIGAEALTQNLPAVIERDRIYMARRPGMVDKHLPLVIDPEAGGVRSGGRYLFDTYANAVAYADWVRHGFVLDGTHFLERSYFLDPDCRAWHTVGARDFRPVNANRVAMRTERWKLDGVNAETAVQSRWPAVRDAAARRGLAAVWLLWDPAAQLAEVVSFAERSSPLPGIDPAALVLMKTAKPMDAAAVPQGAPKLMDLTEFVLTIWFPNTPIGDGGRASLWPNSPGLPSPNAVDGVCEPSRGETYRTAPVDCTPRCGDGAWQAGEDNKRCPSDVPAF